MSSTLRYTDESICFSKRYDLFVFDLDGTLIDSRADIVEAANAMLRHVGVPELPAECVIAHVGSGVRQLLRQLFLSAGILDPSPDLIARAEHFFMTAYGEHCTDATVFYPYVEDCLAHLNSHRLAILSNKPESLSHKILIEFGQFERFYPIIGGDSLPTKKPSPEGLISIMNELEIAPQRTLMVGDSPIDIETAKRAGTDSLALCSGFSAASILRAAAPSYLLNNFEELFNHL